MEYFEEQIEFMTEQLKVIRKKGGKNKEALLATILAWYELPYDDFMIRDKYRNKVNARRMYMWCCYHLLSRTQLEIAEEMNMLPNYVCREISIVRNIMLPHLRKHDKFLRSEFGRYLAIKKCLENSFYI